MLTNEKIAQACKGYETAMLNSLPAPEDCKHVFSRDYEEKMAEIMKPKPVQIGIDKQIAVARIEQLRRRAAKLPEGESIIAKLNGIEKAARTPKTAEEDAAEGKAIAAELNGLEDDLRAREAREIKNRESRKQDMALAKATGELAASLTGGR